MTSPATLLVAPITVDAFDAALAKAHQALAGGASAVEFRVDRQVLAVAQVCALVAASPLPCIITCRHACETGGFDGPEAARVELYAALAAAPKPPLGLDVELAKWEEHRALWRKLAPHVAVPASPRAGRSQLILSSHDFTGRPVDLADRLARMLAEPLCSVPKLAWKAQGLEDCALALRLLAQSPRPAVALAMGEAGMPSRILAKKAGAFMTFAALDKESGTAPGQPLLAEMIGLYRWNDIKPATKVYGVVGCPVGHSMSPAIHNAGFAETGFDGVYVPMRIEEGYENFTRALEAWIQSKELDFGGASVTIPHKENLLRMVEEQGGEAEVLATLIGAANTLGVDASRRLSAANSDYRGLLLPVLAHLGRTESGRLDGLRAAVVGAGGAARAAVAAFAAAGAQVTVFNRSLERAQELAQDFGVLAMPLEALAQTSFDLLVNGTPLGMTPNVDTSPLADGHPALKPGVVVFDTVYNPLETKLLRQAKVAGCACIPGTEMFVLQAAAQFEGWTGQPAPLAVFRNVLGRKLGR